uniref:CvfB family protein n=1 Tax=Ndongobacter massiliensis TaxID=1871025 RepID=UPI00092FF22F|nr:S1-like domain-containing RNA-binding protein [Ndongobacter massiliensis]
MKLGKTQKLMVQRKSAFGLFLSDLPGKREAADGQDVAEKSVLLPNRYVTESMTVGGELDVFVLRDSEDRLVATTRRPLIEVGEMGVLSVADVTKVGAFLHWGLEKDLFLPYDEQTRRIKRGDVVLVLAFIDRSGRIAATMRTNQAFRRPHHLQENDRVPGVVYAYTPEVGTFVLVDGKYNGRIAPSQQVGALRPGQEITARVQGIKPDGKIDLSMHSRAHETLRADARSIAQMLRANGGFLRVNDHSSPVEIRRLFGMSKAQFKRAVGRLLKERQIRLEEGGIRWQKTQSKKNIKK